MTIDEIIQTKRILINIGSGGVGKTTLSAAIALRAAFLGKRSLVLTIDPAKRLADALGIDDITVEEKKVPLPASAKGSMSALMLDMKTTFDRLMEKELPPIEFQELVENPAYRAFSTSLPGTHEFAALQKLYEMEQSQEYDFIVLDTPPAVHALDFLSAPQKIFDVFDNQITRLLIRLYSGSDHLALKLFSFGSQVILKGLARFVGMEALDIIAAFLTHIDGIVEELKKRSGQIIEMLHSPQTGFIVVTTPNPVAVAEAKFFFEELKNRKLPANGIIINRVISTPGDISFPEWGATEPETKKKLEQNYENIRKVSRMHRNLIADLDDFIQNNRDISSEFYHVEIPFESKEIHSIEGIENIIRYLHNNE